MTCRDLRQLEGEIIAAGGLAEPASAWRYN